MAEAFLQLSPQLQYRDPGFIFVDISSTTRLFGGEVSILKRARDLSQSLQLETSLAIADHPSTAQTLSVYQPSYISPPNRDSETLKPLPLAALNHLEGLISWSSTAEVQDADIREIVSFFNLVGLRQVGDVQKIPRESWHQQWGKTGEMLWRKIHGQDQQLISPYLPQETLLDSLHFDFSVSLRSFLLHSLEKRLQILLARLQGRGQLAQKLRLHLHCEYSQQQHFLEVHPALPTRDSEVLMKLLEHKLASIETSNPIQQVEFEILPVAERVEQLDFWQPRIKDQDRIKDLQGLLRQAEINSGFVQLKDELLPEESWQLSFDFMDYEPLEDQVHIDGQSFQIKPVHSQHLRSAPRPSLLLPTPKALSSKELRQLEFLSAQPTERLEESWWEISRGRDYYLALSSKGECLWIYHDRIEDRYYLHGYY